MNWYKKAKQYEQSNIGDIIIRYTHKDGRGLLNNNSLDFSKLNDDEDQELIELRGLGLQQPTQGTTGTFYFTQQGEIQHKRMIDLLSKASKTGVIRNETQLQTIPVWESDDGQIAI